MSRVTAVSHPWRIEFDRPAQIQALLIGLAFCGVFYNVILDLAYEWRHSSDWSHGWLIPVFSLFLVNQKWDLVRRCAVKHTWVGLLLLVAGLAAYQVSLWWIVIGYIRPLSMLICLLGVILFLNGLPVLRYVWAPWLFLFFAVPLPKGVYFALTDPLRRIAATVATFVLSLLPGLDHVDRIGSTIEYSYNGVFGKLGVADACSGMRSTITLCALGVAVAFASDRPAWQRIVMVLSCVPIAVFSNFIRVTVTCMLHIFVDPKYAEGTYHIALGLVTLLMAFGIFSGLGWVLNHLTVEEPDEPESAAA